MPRRNNRADRFEPLDLTPADVRLHVKRGPIVHMDPVQARRERAERERERIERQRQARINGGMDWSVCLVPGCGDELQSYGRYDHHDPASRDHTLRLPLCVKHLVVAYQQARPGANDALMVKANTELIERKEAKAREQRDADREAWKARHDGNIYFVRLNGLVKAGWSRDVHERLRAYGPDVEVLAVYPGTRQDETDLHRQLRPALARGREWYEDGPIVAAFVAQAIAEHGEPEVATGWTQPKQVIRLRRRR